MAPTIGLAKRNANQKKLVGLIAAGLFSGPLWGQVPDIGWQNNGAQGLGVADSLIYVNDINAEELIRHPLLTQDEGLSIIQHRTQHGEILDLMELQQCHFTANRLIELRPYLVFSPSIKLARAEWIQELRSPKGNHSYSNTYYPNSIKSTLNSLGGPWGHSLQLRWNNGQTISFGGSLQMDPGETVQHGNTGIGANPSPSRTFTELLPLWKNFPFRQWHARIGNIPVGKTFRIEKLTIGRYNLQLGQGLVQGGLSGFWSAPLLWARKTPDWDLSEKRGFDEYRGHSGMAMAIHWGGGGKPLSFGILANKCKLRSGNRRRGNAGIENRGNLGIGSFHLIACYSDDWISARTDTLGRIQSLISDGKFNTESSARWFKNTKQKHGTIAVQYQSLRRCTYGISWSGYRYSRPWNALGEWMDCGPALRAGPQFHYPQFWCTHFQKSGGMWFLNLAAQLSHEYRSAFYPIAYVMGYVKPLGKKADLSLRYYHIQRNFRPPQGLFNELQRNHQRISITLSSTPNSKYSMKIGAEIGKNLRYNADGEKPASINYQLGISAKYSKEWSLELLWQLQRNKDNSASEFNESPHYSPTQGIDYRTKYGGLNSQRSQTIHGFRERITVVALYRPASGWAVQGKICLLPTNQNSLLSMNQANEFTTQINPNYYKNSMLAAISFTHRKPFTPLKITFETLCYQSNTPFYHQPTTTATEIANYVLSGQGYGANCLVQYTFKIKLHSAMISNSIFTKSGNHKLQTAIRAEFLHKNNSQFPNQPRIFVMLCWK